MARPKSTKQHQNVYLEKEVIDKLEMYAKEHDTTVSDVITNFVKNNGNFSIPDEDYSKEQMQRDLNIIFYAMLRSGRGALKLGSHGKIVAKEKYQKAYDRLRNASQLLGN